ncbi:4108_t:CDS:2 [Dentiscutata heterogama]|uniref:4108_t:CDS:1 n=1 Tax=Dentiscutata heterogama TaxID=1316150 RepID=A0ACA9K9M4_9GLOM|nr:4108_t:CDS:2 [Dentiscutata heterogama]
MSFVLASHSTAIQDYRSKYESTLPLPPEKIQHLRLKYFKQIIPGFEVAPAPIKQPDGPLPEEPKICIIGAGMAGLFSALLLQKNFKNIQILECQNRVGGRVHTQYFEGDKEQRLYVELGAMRLPETKEHRLVFDTIDYLNHRITHEKDKIHENFDKGIKLLMQFDEHSVYSYLRENLDIPEPYDLDETIAAIEMTESATGLFRLALVEAVMDAYTFLADSQKWKTIDYGMQRFPDAFKLVYKQEEESNGLGHVRIKYNHKVYKLEYVHKNNKVHVHWKENGKSIKDIFDKVIVTCPLGVVRQWDLLGLDKNDELYHKRRAIRELNYDKSAKLFLKFKTRFWENGTNPIIGGSSSTDLPIRTVIYPSYYVDNKIPTDNPAILLGSYTWANDAEKYAPYSQKENANLCAENLKILHGREVVEENLVTEEFSSIYWPNDTTAVGAFALFGPAQFTNLMYPMLKPMNNIYWAGEHTDIHHAWIVGALNSAVRVVKEIMVQLDMERKWNELKEHELLKNWHGNVKI